jgi:hypothetical protein
MENINEEYKHKIKLSEHNWYVSEIEYLERRIKNNRLKRNLFQIFCDYIFNNKN